MKRLLSLIVFFGITSNFYAQSHLMYKCKSVTQKDSISLDLVSKGYTKYDCESNGIYLNFQSDNTFCFNSSLMGYKEITFKELYSKVKVVLNESVPAVDVEIESENLCSDIEIKEDKFTNEISYDSPYVDNISFIKVKRKGMTNQYVSISVYSTYLSGYSEVGLIILFKDGKKIVRSKEKIDVNNSTGSNWRYSVFFTPTANEISLFKNSEIEAVKLYIFDANISQGNTLKEYANCVLVTPKVVPKKKK
jgi:hypothetical protein